jgi:hypothetical protein
VDRHSSSDSASSMPGCLARGMRTQLTEGIHVSQPQREGVKEGGYRYPADSRFFADNVLASLLSHADTRCCSSAQTAGFWSTRKYRHTATSA